MAIIHPVPTARPRRRVHPRVPFRLGALAAAVLSLVWVAGAQASTGARVSVGGRTVTIPGSSLQGDGGTYTLRQAAGSAQRVTLHGLSIHSLLSAAGVDPGTVTSVTVGSATPLSSLDISDPPPFLEGPALVGTRNGHTFFFRPVRDSSDVNGPDYIQTPSGLPIDVVVAGPTAAPTVGGALQVTATASPTQTSVGALVSFAALVNNAPPGPPPTYSWSFGDGASALGVAPTHTYSADGDYPAAVTVAAGQGASVVASVTVHVGHPHRRANGSGLGNSNATGVGAGGAGTGKGGTGGGSGTGGKGVTQPHPTPKPAVRQPVQPAHPAGAAAKTATAAAAATASQAVRGVLLADAGAPLDLRLSPPPPSGTPGAAHKSTGGGGGFPAVVGGLALALAIAALGGVTERRRGSLGAA